MKADSLKMSKVFASGGDIHYILPHFQRQYAWEKKHWQILLNDVFMIYDAYDSDKEPEHFMGSLVVINDGSRNGTVPAYKVVDGQQRLTTISLLLCAMKRIADDHHTPLKNKLSRLLVNMDEVDYLHYKLLPTTKYGDRSTYMAIISGEKELPQHDSNIPLAFDFFEKELQIRYQKKQLDLDRLFLVVNNCLQVVFIDLNQNERPYQIFESLNNKGMALSQADLVRNYIAMKLPEVRQAEVFDKHWSKIEEMLQEKRTVGRSRLGELTAFLRHYLSLQYKTLLNEEHVYARFRDRVENEFKDPGAFENEVVTLKRFASYYDRLLRPEKEADKNIRPLLERLTILEMSTAFPFLLAAYDSLSNNQITASEFIEGLKILENYLVRRHIVGEATNYTNKMFTTLWKEINPANYVASLRDIIVTKKYPSAHRLRQSILSEGLYEKRLETRRKLALILDSVNRHLSDQAQSGAYTVLSDEPTIEHIMPQKLSSDWKKALGTNWEQVHNDFLDTLGNLTLVTQDWNSSLSNDAFLLKKAKLQGHGLELNRVYFNQPIINWDEGAIRARSEWLADHITNIWPELGTPPSASVSTFTKPISLFFMGQTFTVSTWREVAFITAQEVSGLADDFDSIANKFPTYFDRKEFKNVCKQLNNGWWIYLNLSAASIKSLCRNIIVEAGIPEDDWVVEEI